VIDTIRSADGLSQVRSEQRRARAVVAYDRLASAATRPGAVTLALLEREFEGDWHPDVAHHVTQEDVLITRLLAHFNKVGSQVVTQSDFVEFYALISRCALGSFWGRVGHAC